MGHEAASRPFHGFAGNEDEETMNLRSGLSRRPIQAALVDKLADLVERVSATFGDVPFEAKFERLVLACRSLLGPTLSLTDH